MRVLVTGSDGQIGKELVKLLDQHDKLLIDKKSGNDLNDIDAMAKIRQFKPEAVFHLAATFERVAESPEFINHNFDDNILATHNLLKVLDNPYNIVFASSYLVYDPRIYTNGGIVHIYEEAPTRPRNLCGSAKLYLEAEINKYAQLSRTSVAHARIFRVYSNESKCFVNHFVDTARLGGTVNVWNTSSYLDLIHAKDVAYALYLMMDKNLNGIFNVGTGSPISVADVIAATGVKTRQAIDTSFTEKSASATGKLNLATGWRPMVKFADEIRDMLNPAEETK